MAISAAGIWECRTAGSDTNAGLFVPGGSGTDFSQADTPTLSLTDVVTNSTTTVTSATGGFLATYIDNGINIAGTVYQITARTDTNTITVDRTTGTGSGQTGKVGGACASPGYVAGQMVNGNDVHVKFGTYLMTSSTPNVSGGIININKGLIGNNHVIWEGYQTTRGDLGTKPIFRASGISSATLVGIGSSGIIFRNLDIDGDSLTSITGIANTDNGLVYAIERCLIRNCATGINPGLTQHFIQDCEITGCTANAAMSGNGYSCYFGCRSHANSCSGFRGAAHFINCISASNTGASSRGFADIERAVNCLAYVNGESGFEVEGNGAVESDFLNCLAVGHTGSGFSNPGTNSYAMALRSCAGYNNTGGNVNANVLRPTTGFLTLTADPFVNAAGGNFALNNTAGGGAALRAAGIPGSWAAVGLPNTTGYPDIGAVQAQSASLGNKTPYNLAAKEILDGTLGGVADSTLANSTLKIMLVTSGYVADADHTVVDNGANNSTDPSFNEISVTGYTPGWGASGRQTVGGKSFSANDTSDRGILDATDPVWTSLGAGATIAGAILIKEGVANDTTSRLIAYYALTPYITEGVGLRLQLDTSGLLLY